MFSIVLALTSCLVLRNCHHTIIFPVPFLFAGSSSLLSWLLPALPCMPSFSPAKPPALSESQPSSQQKQHHRKDLQHPQQPPQQEDISPGLPSPSQQQHGSQLTQPQSREEWERKHAQWKVEYAQWEVECARKKAERVSFMCMFVRLWCLLVFLFVPYICVCMCA